MYKIIYTSNYSSVFNILVKSLIHAEDKIKNFSHLFYNKQKLPSLTHDLFIRAPSIHVVYPYSIYSHCHELSAQLCPMISCLCLAWNMNSLFKIEMLTYPGWGLLEEDRCVQLQDRFENLFQTKEDVRNRWLRTENRFNSTYWYRVRISQVTEDPLNKLCSSNPFTYRLFQILRWSSLKKLVENNDFVSWKSYSFRPGEIGRYTR